MKKSLRFLEDAAGANEAAPAPGAAPAPKTPAPGADGSQGQSAPDDEIGQLKALVAQHAGAENQEALSMAQECYAGHKEMGSSHEEALKHTEASMKLAKHMHEKKTKEAAKEAAKEGDKPAGDDATKSKEAADSAAGQVPATQKSETPALPVLAESAKKITELTAENLKLRESLRKVEQDEHLDKVLKESKLPTRVTDKFRLLVKEAKTTAEIDAQLKIFKEAYAEAKAEGSSETGSEGGGFALFMEKAGRAPASPEGSSGSGGGMTQFVNQ